MYSGCMKLSLSDRKQRDIKKKGALISSTGFYETNILESLPRIEVFEGGKWQNGSSTNITQNRVFVWIGETGQKIIRVCMEFCKFCKISHLDNFPQKTLKLGRVAFHSLTFQF